MDAGTGPTAGELLQDNLRRRVQGLHQASSSLAHPARTLRRARATWPAWREYFAEQRAPRTSLNRPIGADRRLALISSRLDMPGRLPTPMTPRSTTWCWPPWRVAYGSCSAAAGNSVEHLMLRAMVPVSLHREQPGQARGNQDGSMVVPLPIGEPDHVRRLQLIAAETAKRKNKAHPQMGSGIFRFAVAQRAFVRLFTRQRLMNITVTNVPGPPVPLYLAGAPLLDLFPVVSLVANLTLTVAVLSYAGQLNITAVADRNTAPIVEVFAQGVRSALDDLALSALVPSS